MEKEFTQEQFEQLQTVMKARLELIATYISKGMIDCAMLELGFLECYMDVQHNNVMNLLPGKQI